MGSQYPQQQSMIQNPYMINQADPFGINEIFTNDELYKEKERDLQRIKEAAAKNKQYNPYLEDKKVEKPLEVPLKLTDKAPVSQYQQYAYSFEEDFEKPVETFYDEADIKLTKRMSQIYNFEDDYETEKLNNQYS